MWPICEGKEEIENNKRVTTIYNNIQYIINASGYQT